MAERKEDIDADSAAIKAELKNIKFRHTPNPFLRTFSLDEWTSTPAVDVNRRQSQDVVGGSEPVPSLPTAFSFISSQALEDKEKHVAFGDEKGDSGAIRKNQTFAGSLSDVIGHSDEAYPHVHHVMSRHRPHRPRKIIQEKAEKLPTLDEHEMRPIARAETEEETEGEKSPQPKGKLFSVGGDHEESDNDQDKNMDEEMRKRRKRRHKHHHKSHFTEDELELRRAKGSELAMERMDRIFQMEDDDEDLDMRDYEDLSHNRFDHLHAYERHKISSRKGSANFSIHGPTSVKDRKKMDKFMETLFPDEAAKEIDHTPHALFVEMDELINNEWVEQARWIKYEESREEGAERWGKPHVSSLSFHSLLNLRLHLERGVTMLDVEARDMTNLLFSIVEEFNLEGLLDDDLKSEVLRMLLFRHRYVDGDQNTGLTGIRRNLSHLSLHSRKNSAKDHATLAEEGRSPSQQSFGAQSLAQAMLSLGGSALDMDIVDKTRYPILNRMPEDSEGALTLCGAMECLSKPMIAFVRLAEGYRFKQALEIPIPLRFVIVILTPKPSPFIDCHEVGRSFSTLMSNEMFHNVCYTVDNKDELMQAISDYLDESIVLPPGDWASRNLLSLQEIQEMRKRKKQRREALEKMKSQASEKSLASKASEAESTALESEAEPDPYDPNDPMSRAPYPFGGLINDLKRRMPHYLSDFKDGLNPQVLAAACFIYFAALSGAIAFGGLLGEKTKGYIGVPETLIVSSVAGVIFSLFAGMPLIIIGVTGPVLLFDEALFKFADGSDSIDFLAFRVWVGIWLVIIALVVAFFQGSVMVKHFTKFTKEIFASLISLLFIFEAFNKLSKIFKAHPLQSVTTHCSEYGSLILDALDSVNESAVGLREPKGLFDNFTFTNETLDFGDLDVTSEPNTALLSAFLMFATFAIAYYLRIFRNGKYLGRTARRALGDFGVPIAIVLMILVDNVLITDTYTEKLNVPEGLSVTNSDLRGWFINPVPPGLPAWIPFAASIPAILLFVLLFMETQICELLMMERTNAKGAGVHWDIVLLCGINCFGAFFGGPWICAATVRAVAHVSALTVMSTTHAPGEQPRIIEVKDQRVSFLLVSVLLGVSVLLAPVLKLVPFAVLFGVFLYMGISSMNGIQLFDRISLLFTPVKHHPSVSYVRRVKTWRMHMYTIVQIAGLAVLWAVKSSPIALFFPFFVLAMVPLRMVLKFIYTPAELEALDGKEAGKVVRDDEPDFYEQGGLGA